MNTLDREGGAMSAPAEPLSMVDVLRGHAARADKPAFIFLKDGETEASRLTFAQLDSHARALAVLLLGHLRQGDRVILLFPAGLEFVVAVFGCMYAGLIAVPVSQPRRQQTLDKLDDIARNCEAAMILTLAALAPELAARLGDRLADLPVVAMDAGEYLDQAGALAARWRPPALDGASLAFLQYTSGSTGTPKGVAITHANLLANQRMLQAATQQNADSVRVSWLPAHHDMGLVGNVLQSAYLGALCVLMSPMAFMQRPIRWLIAISKYRATISGGPNFAYELCNRAIPAAQLAGLDLSCWQIAFNGAEPVSAHTLQRFNEKFSLIGFASHTLSPCYGMAEATVFISGNPRGLEAQIREVCAEALENNQIEPPRSGKAVRSLVGCGIGWGNQQLVIADPDSQRRHGEEAVGEIWVRGAHIAQGYWNNEQATREYFDAYLLDSGEGPFLRTGDLGFIAQGQLYITGRRKELIIIKGRNLYPHDIESLIAASHEALSGGSGAAFSIDHGGEEKLVVVHEVVRRHLDAGSIREIVYGAREAVAHHIDVQLYKLVLIPPNSIPKTTSGKIQRGQCRSLYLRQALPELLARS